jgi:NADP-dependent 3-hydroxy acid dehydrogenase YdfG
MIPVLRQFCLDGRVAIVTGASSGLDAGFAQAGADLVLVTRREDKLADTRMLVEAESRRSLTVRATSPPRRGARHSPSAPGS